MIRWLGKIERNCGETMSENKILKKILPMCHEHSYKHMNTHTNMTLMSLYCGRDYVNKTLLFVKNVKTPKGFGSITKSLMEISILPF